MNTSGCVGTFVASSIFSLSVHFTFWNTFATIENMLTVGSDTRTALRFLLNRNQNTLLRSRAYIMRTKVDTLIHHYYSSWYREVDQNAEIFNSSGSASGWWITFIETTKIPWENCRRLFVACSISGFVISYMNYSTLCCALMPRALHSSIHSFIVVSSQFACINISYARNASGIHWVRACKVQIECHHKWGDADAHSYLSFFSSLRACGSCCSTNILEQTFYEFKFIFANVVCCHLFAITLNAVRHMELSKRGRKRTSNNNHKNAIAWMCTWELCSIHISQNRRLIC